MENMGQLEDMSDELRELRLQLEALLDHFGFEMEEVWPDFKAFRDEGKPLVERHWEVKKKETPER
jgi:hypothetical protein